MTPFCTTCHAGAAAPLGLRLDEGAAYAMLVNAPSVQVPTMLRVAPGDPDASYLIQKLEGAPTIVGGRMPLNAPPLPTETIAVIREWIVAGALALSESGSETPPQLTAVWPVEGTTLAAPPDAIVLRSDGELDATLLDAGVLSLRASGGDGDFANGDEASIDHRIEVRSLAPTVIAVIPAEGSWINDRIELRVSGGDPLALADRNARPIDGDRDGAAGGDFVLRFAVENAR